MSESRTTARPTTTPASRGDDWATTTADTIERVIGSVRSKTADPLDKLARGVVYGLLAAFLGFAVLVLTLIMVVRGLVIALDLVWQPEVWPVYLVLGGIFVLAGLFLWRKRTAKTVKV